MFAYILKMVMPRQAVLVAAGGLFLALPLFLNGFPLVYIDSGFYILHWPFYLPADVPLWRPLVYTLILKIPTLIAYF